MNQVEVIASSGAVTVNALQQDFAGAAILNLLRPLHRSFAGRSLSALSENFRSSVFVAQDINADDHRLAAEGFGPGGNQFGRLNGGGIQSDLVRPATKAFAHCFDAADAPAPRQWHEAGFADRIENRERVIQTFDPVILAAQVVRLIPSDVQIDQFIHIPLIEPLDLVNRVADDLVDFE